MHGVHAGHAGPVHTALVSVSTSALADLGGLVFLVSSTLSNFYGLFTSTSTGVPELWEGFDGIPIKQCFALPLLEKLPPAADGTK